MRRTLASTTVLFSALFAFFAASAAAEIPLCDGTYSQKTLYTDQGVLESVIVGNAGRLYFAGTPSGVATGSGQLLKIQKPGDTPIPLVDGPPGPGGLAWSGRKLLWGYGNSVANGSTGDTDPKAGLYSVNPVNGKKTVVADDLGMANGITRARNGTIFASNDLGTKLDRIKDGTTTNGWATLAGANGLTISRGGKYLYANQTFLAPSRISRIEIADPSNIITYAMSPDPGTVILDGLTRDNEGSLYAAAWGAGQVWKIDSKKRICVVASGLKQPSNLAFGAGKKGFQAGNLYVVGFGGEIVKVSGAIGATFPG
ncbi:MAG: SMP-30/gluconolactonase/LRE family protein [Thermoleophilia bacterium]|nr:SMP-30/gluconolactonase/LRE family protein [Thermoleophilia bacterium]